MYPIRCIAVAVWFFGFSLAFLPVVFLRPFDVRNSKLYARILSSVAIGIMGFEIEVRNPERYETSRPCIFVLNHQSLIDVFVFGYVLPKNAVSIGKKSLKWFPLFGWIFWLGGNLFIDRRNRERAMVTMKQTEEMVMKKGLSVVIAPEGTRSGKAGLLPFKRGPFYLAVNTGLPLQPLVISSYHKGLNFWRLKSGRVIVDTLEPIPVRGRSVDELKELCYTVIQKALNQLDEEIAARPI